MLENLKTSSDIQEGGDYIPGGRLMESDVYKMAIQTAYFDQSEKGAISVNIELVNSDKKTMSFTEYVTSGNEKGNKNYYEKDGVKNYLPGFNLINNLCLLANGQELSEQTVVDKQLNVWNGKEKKKTLQTKKLIESLTGLEITVGILKRIVDKKVKDPTGMYVSVPGESRTENVLDKVFDMETLRTVQEIRGNVEKPIFHAEWIKSYKGQVIDLTTKPSPGSIAKSGGSGTSGNSLMGNGLNKAPSPAKTIFNKN